MTMCNSCVLGDPCWRAGTAVPATVHGGRSSGQLYWWGTVQPQAHSGDEAAEVLSVSFEGIAKSIPVSTA